MSPDRDDPVAVGRGLGATQRAALAALTEAADRREGIYVNDLAGILGITPDRCRALARSLRDRGLVRTETRGYLQGIGDRGKLIRYVPNMWHEDIRDALPIVDVNGTRMVRMGTPAKHVIVFLVQPDTMGGIP